MLANSADPTRKWFGVLAQSELALYEGRSAEALTWAERAARAYQPGAGSATARMALAEILLARGESAPAVQQAQQALADAKGFNEERGALALAAATQAVAGRPGDAEQALAALGARAEPLAQDRDARQLAFARGRAALARRDLDCAIKELETAQALLKPRAFNQLAGNPYIAIWYTLGEAYLAAGRSDDAATWFQRVASSGSEHARYPIQFVRSFYFLGTLHEKRGDMAKARDAYEVRRY